MIEDAELLRRYAEEKVEPAFAELVRRHVNFVYACALRRVGGDTHLAEDVTQQVFTALARDAAALSRRPVLAGWLFTTTRFSASQIVRTERRRQAREQEAHSMKEILAEEGASGADWEKLRPLLDDTLDELSEADREAVLLRFFEQQSFAVLGAKLGLTENTARMRVERALDKLHGLLAQRGVTSTTAALGLALVGQATMAAPVGLAASVTGAALATTAAGSLGWLTTFMTMNKLQLGIAGAVALAGGSVYLVQAETNASLQREVAGLRGGQSALAALRLETQTLAAATAEIEMLRRDDAEFQRLAQRGAETEKTIKENQRFAQVRDNQRSVQAEVDRMNREGNSLVEEYKMLAEGAKNSALTVEAKAAALATAQLKLEAIKAKQREINAFKASHPEVYPQAPTPAPVQNAQVDQMNREGGALVEEYKALVEGAKDPTLTEDAKAAAKATVELKLEAIKAKQREIAAFKASHPEIFPPMTGPVQNVNAPAVSDGIRSTGSYEFRRVDPSNPLKGEIRAQ